MFDTSVHMYVSAPVYMCVVCMFVHVCLYFFVWVCMCLNVCACICPRVCVCVCVCVCVMVQFQAIGSGTSENGKSSQDQSSQEAFLEEEGHNPCLPQGHAEGRGKHIPSR